jgi:hypothetical protein
MQISSLSALSGASSLFGSSAGRQTQPQTAGQIMPNPATPAPSNKVFSLPRANLTAAAAPQASAVSRQLSAEKAAAAYQSAMNAKGLYGYQSMLGATSLMA